MRLTILTVVISVLSIACCASAQRDADLARCIQIEVNAPSPVSGAAPETMRFVRNAAGANLATVEWVDANGAIRLSAALPFHDVGTVLMPRHIAGSGAACGYLVTGREYAATGASTLQGHIVRLSANFNAQGVPQLVIDESQSTGPLDITLMAISERDRYLLAFDYGTRRLLVADMAGKQLPSILPVASAWQDIADSSTIGSLVKKMSSTHTEFRVVDRGDVAVLCPFDAVTTMNVVHREATGGWTVQNAAIPTDYFVQCRSLVCGLEPLSFWASASVPQGETWTLSGPGGQITSGSVSPGQTNVIGVIPEMHVNPSETYSIGISSSGDELLFKPAVRYMQPGSTQSAFSVERVVCNPTVAVGKNYNSQVGIDTSISGSVAAFLVANVRDAGGNDPLTWVGNTPVLDSLASVAFQFDAQHVRSGVGRSFPIPAGTEGLVVLFQYVFFLPEGHVAVSEVFGGRIVADGFAALMSSREDLGPNRRSTLSDVYRADPERVARVRRSMQGGDLGAAATRLREQVLQRLRRQR